MSEPATDLPHPPAPSRVREGEQRARVDTIDYAKGVGILLVVIGHVWRGLESAKIALPQPAFHAMDRWVYGFHMSLFFFVSGLFLYRSAAKPAGTYLTEKVSTLVWPYLLWSVVYWQLSSFGSGGSKLAPVAFVQAVAIHPIGHLWFLWVLFAISLLVLVLRKMFAPAWAVLISAIGLWLAAKYGAPIRGSFFQLAMFFPYVAAAGAIAPLLLKWIPRLPIWVWMILAVTGASVVTWATRNGSGDDHMFDVLSGSAGIVMVLGLARILEHDRVTSFKFLGQRSLEIYLAHILAAAVIRTALLKLHVTDWRVHLPAGFIAGVLGPLALWYVCTLVRFPYLFRLGSREKALA